MSEALLYCSLRATSSTRTTMLGSSSNISLFLSKFSLVVPECSPGLVDEQQVKGGSPCAVHVNLPCLGTIPQTSQFRLKCVDAFPEAWLIACSSYMIPLLDTAPSRRYNTQGCFAADLFNPMAGSIPSPLGIHCSMAILRIQLAGEFALEYIFGSSHAVYSLSHLVR